ncbi:hypothetical protein D3C87_1735530 [compost metagenome]
MLGSSAHPTVAASSAQTLAPKSLDPDMEEYLLMWSSARNLPVREWLLIGDTIREAPGDAFGRRIPNKAREGSLIAGQ